MVEINKQEKEMIAEAYPDVHIVRTSKQKSHRHHYYCTETRGVMELLSEFRTDRKAGVTNGLREKN